MSERKLFFLFGQLFLLTTPKVLKIEIQYKCLKENFSFFSDNCFLWQPLLISWPIKVLKVKIQYNVWKKIFLSFRTTVFLTTPKTLKIEIQYNVWKKIFLSVRTTVSFDDPSNFSSPLRFLSQNSRTVSKRKFFFPFRQHFSLPLRPACPLITPVECLKENFSFFLDHCHFFWLTLC